MPTKEQEILTRAKEFAVSMETWADLSNALFDPLDGIAVKPYPTRELREQFIKTAEYKEIRNLLTDKMQKTGRAEGAIPQEPSPDWMTKADTAHDTSWTDYQNAFNTVIRAGETGEGMAILKERCERIKSAYLDAMFAVYLKSRHALNEALMSPVTPTRRMLLATAYYRSEGALASLLAILENVVLVMETRSRSQTPDTGTEFEE